MSTPVRSAAMLCSTPTKSPWGGRTPSSQARRNILSSPTPTKRDSLVKVTFKQKSDLAQPKTCMYITGSLPSLGCWDAKKARRMHLDEDGKGNSWSLCFYIPEKVEFLYQYFLADDSEKSEDGSPKILWEGGLERKCHVSEAADTPNKSMLLTDDTRGEQSPMPPFSAMHGAPRFLCSDAAGSTPIVQNIASSHFSQAHELDGLQSQVSSLEAERERCRNELLKLQDMMCISSVPVDGKSSSERDSYIPDAGLLYDQVKELQSLVRGKVLAPQDPASVNADLHTLRSELEGAHAITVAELEGKLARLGGERAEGHAAELAAAQLKLEGQKEQHMNEIAELKEYYSKTMDDLDDNQKLVAEEKARVEESRMMLQTNVRVVAGEVQGIRATFSELRGEAERVKAVLMPEIDALRAQIQEGVSASAEGMENRMRIAVDKLSSETKERKRLHNLVQELKGNIRVFCRVRPSKEGEGGGAVDVTSEQNLLLETSGRTTGFEYDRVFAPSSSQAEVFEETEPLVVSVLDGYNVCIFAYGQTGSGKTHTMQGYDDAPGVNVRALSSLFEMAGERSSVSTYSFSVSLMEIYNETIKDLVEPKDEAGQPKRLDVKGAPEGGTHVPGLCTREVASMSDVHSVLEQGQKHRSVGSTNMNEQSSRSHMVLTVFVQAQSVKGGATSFGKMHLIDLAGSERIGKSGAQGDRLKEAQNINKSLSALGDCVQSLVGKSKHVPFRNSKLTYLLQDSLGGDSKALMFVCVSPGEPDAPETLCSLNFAARVRNVELGPAKKKGDGGAEVRLRERERELEQVREEARRDKAEADKLRARLGEMKRDAEALQAATDAAKRDADAAKRDAASASQLAARNAAAAAQEEAAKREPLAPERVPATSSAPRQSIMPTIEPTSRLLKPVGGRPRSAFVRAASAGDADFANECDDKENTDEARAPEGDAKVASPRTDAGLSLDERLAKHRAQKRAAALAQQGADGRDGGGKTERPASAPPSRLGVASRIGGPARVTSQAVERKPLVTSLSGSSKIPRR